jgi:DNA-binding XRE family transcriptional regulator
VEHSKNEIISTEEQDRMGMDRKQRQARDAAFAEALEALKPENMLRQEMIAARGRARLTQAQLAAEMGTTQSTIARLEAGRSSPSIQTLRKLAAATGSRLVVKLEKVRARDL